MRKRRFSVLAVSVLVAAPVSVLAQDAPPPAGPVTVAVGIAAATGPRTSPFNPPEENDHSFVTDAAPKLDTGCIFSSLGPIEFDVEVTRHVGRLNGDGTLQDADALIQAGLLSDKATLILPAFDVDSSASPPPPFLPERDRVKFNGEEIGFLSGENNTWKLNSFEFDIRKVKFADRGARGSAPQGAKNRVTIDIDVANFPTEVWCTSIDWASASFKAMSPIIVVHGNNSDGGFFERRGFTAELDQRHLLFDNSINLTTSTVAVNGGTLDGFIPGIVKSFGVDSVHLVAHSKGGLDSREYLARFQPGHEKEFTVLSYTTLSTPHNGSVGADLLVLRDQAATQAAETEFQGFPSFTQRVLAQITTDAGTANLTTGFTAGFNAGNLPGVSGKIVFNTVAADADTNANGEIDRSPDEYADLRAESAQLQALDNETFGQTKTRIAVNLPYQILRRSASITLRFEDRKKVFGGTKRVAVLTANPSAQPLGNDVLVTIPSGQGAGSVASRTRNTRVFNGAQGRNHSNVANGGVAQVVIPWLIDVEKQSGDLK